MKSDGFLSTSSPTDEKEPRRITIPSDDIEGFYATDKHAKVKGWLALPGEERIGAELEVPLPMRLKAERLPYAMDGGCRQTRGVHHGSTAPVGAAVGRRGVEGLGDQLHDL